MPGCLDDVVALIHCPPDPVANARAAISSRIEKHGGRVAARLGKDVSHVIWERRHSRRPSDKAADEADLLELFRKLEKADYPPVVVSPLWVEESIKAGRRLVERKYLVKKPTESLLGRTPGSGTGAAAKKRKRPAAQVLPKPAEAYELDELVFSSTQQMTNDGAGAGSEATSPRAGGSKQPRRGGARAAGARGGRRQAAATMPAVVEDAEEEEEEEEEAAADEAGQQGGADPAAARIGTDTQAVANILTIDLPDDEPGHTPGPPAEEDELDTPLALRFAKSSAERASTWGSGGSSGGQGRPGSDRQADGGAAGGGGGGARSRLALVSGPQQQQQQQQAAAAAEEEAADAIEEADSEEEPMQVDASPANAAEQATDPPAEEQQQEEVAAEEERPATAEADRGGRAAAQRAVAERFSVRQLVQHPERPVVVHKGTPLGQALPGSPRGRKPSEPIPIPVVERVTSPWTLAEQVAPTQPSQSQASQPAAAPAAAPAEATGRPSVGGQAPPRRGRRSLLGVSNVRRASGGAGAGGTPASAARPSPNLNPTGADGKLPTPWSTLRPWDSKAAAAAAAAGEAPPTDENKAGPPQQPAEVQQQQEQQEQQQQQQAQRAGQAAGSGGRRTTGHGAAAEPAAAAAAAEGPSQGCIALTSVDGAVVDLAKSAARRLRGLRICPEGKEDGQVTHLVVGDERRTLKLMLAVANGAWLVSPQWVTASLEAGRWLPESQFPAKVRFESAAARARALLEVPDAPPLLGDHAVYIHLPDKARKLMGANAAALKRVAVALGAKVVPPKSCSLCVVVGGGGRPAGIPKAARCVKEEWMLQAAERFVEPSLEEYKVE